MTDVSRANSFLLQIEDPAEAGVYLTVAGQRGTKFTGNDALVDVTNKDSGTQWRQVGNRMGLRHFQCSATGVFSDSAAHQAMMALFLDGEIFSAQIANTDLLTAERGNFKITTFERNGDHEQAIMYSYTLESDGAIETVSIA